MCCSDKLNFSSSLRPSCSPHHEGNMPAPFLVSHKLDKEVLPKKVLGKAGFGILLPKWGVVFISATRHTETERVLTNNNTHCSCCYNMYYWTLENVITQETLSPCFYNNQISYRILQAPQKYFIFNFA